MTIEDLARDPVRSALWWGLFNFSQDTPALTVAQGLDIIDRQVRKLQDAGLVAS